MSNRANYREYSRTDFTEELVSSLQVFLQNMEHLKVDSLSFPEWYETFAAWLEVGTDMEETSYGSNG